VSGRARWTPLAATAIAVHLIGAAGLVLAHRGRIRNQAGVGANTTALTVAALATTANSGMLGAQLARVGAAARQLPGRRS
jgi:hypothetical protein